MPGSGMTGRVTEPVAIVGMDVLLPGADSVESYWNNLVNGVDAISDVPSSRWDPQHYDPGSRPPEPLLLPPRRVHRRYRLVRPDAVRHHARLGPRTEPEQLLALRVASAAIEDAGGMDRLPDRRAGRRDPRPPGSVQHGGHQLLPACPAGRPAVPALGRTAARTARRTARRAAPGVRRQARAVPAGDRHRPDAQPHGVPGRQPARPARPGLHRGRRLRVLADRGRPGDRRADERPLRRGRRRRRPPLPRHHLLVRLHPARGAVPPARASARSTSRRRRAADRRGHRRWSCSSGWPTHSGTATGSTR